MDGDCAFWVKLMRSLLHPRFSFVAKTTLFVSRIRFFEAYFTYCFSFCTHQIVVQQRAMLPHSNLRIRVEIQGFQIIEERSADGNISTRSVPTHSQYEHCVIQRRSRFSYMSLTGGTQEIKGCWTLMQRELLRIHERTWILFFYFPQVIWCSGLWSRSTSSRVGCDLRYYRTCWSRSIVVVAHQSHTWLELSFVSLCSVSRAFHAWISTTSTSRLVSYLNELFGHCFSSASFQSTFCLPVLCSGFCEWTLTRSKHVINAKFVSWLFELASPTRIIIQLE